MIEIIGDRKIKVHWDFGVKNYYLIIKKINGQEDVTPLTIESKKCKLYGASDFTQPLDITFNRIGELYFWFQARDNNNELVYHFDTAMYIINEGEDGDSLYRYLGYIQASEEPNFYSYALYGGNVSTNGLYGYNNIGGGLYKYFRFAIESHNHPYISLPRNIKLYLINDFEYSFDYIPNEEISEIIIEKQYFNGRYESETLFSRNSIILYENQSEDIVLNKRIFRENTMYGEFRDSVSIISPEFTIETTEDVTRYNYCYIPKFRRYYYIEDIICERNNIYTIICKVDVLMSFKEKILQLNCKVERQEFNFNNMLIDSELPTEVENEYVYIHSDVNEEFDSPVFFDMNTKCIAIATTAYKVDKNQTHPSMSNGSTNIYVVNATQLNEISKKIISDNVLSEGIGALFQNAGDGIMNITVYPFDLDNVAGLDAIETDEFQIGLRTIDISNVTLLSNITSISKFICDISIPRKYNNFLDYSPYCDCEMWLPMIGYVKLDVNKLIGKTISIILDVNPINGRGVYRILDNYSNILYVFDCNVGINIPINKSSLNDSVNSLIMTGIRATSRIISLGNTYDVSNVEKTRINRGKSGNVTSVTKQISKVKGEKYFDKDKLPNVIGETTCNIINSLKTHIESGSISNGWESILLPYEVHIVLRYLIPIEVDDYAHLVGKPSSYNGKLDNLNGFTVVGACHMDGFNNATSNEIDEIERIIKTGVILP